MFKSTIYGGLAGLVLGGAIAWASDSDDNAETIRWSFVGGTFFGFGYGIYHVTRRPQPRAALERGAGGWALAMPQLQMDAGVPPGDADVAPHPVGPRGLTVRTTLASVGF